jgi:hypothetical protein
MQQQHSDSKGDLALLLQPPLEECCACRSPVKVVLGAQPPIDPLHNLFILESVERLTQ